jgi:glutathione S-transferase
MQLYHSPTSPYVRKVMVLLHETGLLDRVSLTPATVTPITNDATVASHNPLTKVPTLTLDDGTDLYDSRVICEYLDTLHHGTPMIPDGGDARWRVLRVQATADGLLDAALLTRYETFMRPEDKRWPEWIEGQTGKFQRAVDKLEAEAKFFTQAVTLAEIATACALGYLDFRFAHLPWRDSHPRLAEFMAAFSQRPSMEATKPA